MTKFNKSLFILIILSSISVKPEKKNRKIKKLLMNTKLFIKKSKTPTILALLEKYDRPNLTYSRLENANHKKTKNYIACPNTSLHTRDQWIVKALSCPPFCEIQPFHHSITVE